MRTIVYCHGFGSSSNTEKVGILKELYPNDKVLAFDADIDPIKAKKEVGDKVTISIVDDFSDDQLIFVGTSLGGWLANELANDFQCPAVLINPANDPAASLVKYDIPEEIRNKYTPMMLNNNLTKWFFINPDDKVLDHTELMSKVQYTTISGGHRCTREVFIKVMKSIM